VSAVRKDPAEIDRKGSTDAGAALPRGRVLVVDDEDLVRLVIARKLQAYGFEVQEARDGVAALAVIHQARPDLILSDLNMPRSNGERLCLDVKRDPATAQIPVLIMTGGPTDEARMRAAGCVGILYKPLPDELCQYITSVMHGERLDPSGV
jgi:CheY-like chemotaxis protein